MHAVVFRRCNYGPARIPGFGRFWHSWRMNFTFLSLAVALLGVLSVGGVVMVRGLRNAPDGFEDEAGFHYGTPEETAVPVAVATPDFAAVLDEQLAFAGR